MLKHGSLTAMSFIAASCPELIVITINSNTEGHVGAGCRYARCPTKGVDSKAAAGGRGWTGLIPTPHHQGLFVEGHNAGLLLFCRNSGRPALLPSSHQCHPEQ